MQMNKLKLNKLIPLLLLIAASLSVLAVDNENQAPEPTQAATPSKEPAEATSREDNVTPDTQLEAESAKPAGTATAKPIKPFNPTEQIKADSAVTFPIDI